MTLEIREFKSIDLPVIEKLTEDFEDYLMSIDTFKRLRKESGFGKKYTQFVFQKLHAGEGKMLVALDKEKIVGFGSAYILKQSAEDLLEEGKIKTGKINELYIDKKYRSGGLGKQLVEKLEQYLKEKDCKRVSIGVIATNPAYEFYHKLGYEDLYVDLLKMI